MNYPTAKEMREITESNVRLNIEPYLDVIFEKMKESKGNSINMLYLYKGMNYPNNNEENAIRAKLSELGYKVRHNPDPDPGHPCSCGSYYSVHW